MTNKSFEPHYDAVIVGARCAGAATAMLLARGGAKVLVVDRDRAGTDTMSTHALMRGAVMQLAGWGTLPRILAAGTPAIRKTSFIYGDEAIDLDIKASHGVDALYAPRRTVLDGALAQQASEAGAKIRYRVALDSVRHDADGRVTGAVLRGAGGNPRAVSCNLLIGADGYLSSVARMVGAATIQQSRNASAIVYRYFAGVADHGNRWYYNNGVYAGVIPTNNGESCVFVGMPQAPFKTEMHGRLNEGQLEAADRAFPALGAELRAANARGRAIGFAGRKGHFRAASGPGWALVGDAGYFKDPATAHGITDALRDAEILAGAILRGTDRDLQGYQSIRDGLSREFFEVTDEIAGFDWDLEQLKGMHMRLNKEMKIEQDWMFSDMRGPGRKAS
jgi:flavin-dependent dehydrogenase